MNKPHVVIILFILSSCTTSLKTFQTSDSNKIGVKANKYRGTIFKNSYDKPYFLPSDSLRRFTPTKEDIVLAETILEKQIRTENHPRINQLNRGQYIDRHLNKYFRQYVGFINEQGHRVVHINLHWDRYTIIDRIKGYWDDRLKYNSDFSQVLDGGSRYWNINVNLDTKTLYGLAVNGIA